MSFLVPLSPTSTQTQSVFLSILELNSKSHTIPDRLSTPISASASTDPGNCTRFRSSAENPREIGNLFNSCFASVFAHDNPPPPPPSPSSGSAASAPASHNMSELTLTVSEVQSVLEALDVTKAIRVHMQRITGPPPYRNWYRKSWSDSKIDCVRW